MGKYAVQKYSRKFQCLVRGFGHGNQTPRKQYIIETETNAKASRIALQAYQEEYGTK